MISQSATRIKYCAFYRVQYSRVKANYANYTLGPGTLAALKNTINAPLIKTVGVVVSPDPSRVSVDHRSVVVGVLFKHQKRILIPVRKSSQMCLGKADSMSIQVVIHLEVADFDQFKSVFDARAEHRVAAGLQTTLYRGIDAPHNPVVIGTAPSKDAFLAFFQSPEQQEAMKDAGFTGPPQISLLEEV